MEAIYDRQQSLKLNVPETATIIGCGGTGYWTGLLLAMSGCGNLILVDSDRLEHSNRNRLPISFSEVSASKTSVLKNHILRLRDIRVERHESMIVEAEDCQILRGSVFCCTDNLKSQQLIQAYCRKHGFPYQRIGYDGISLNVSEAFPLTFSKADVPDGYETTPSWVVPAVTAAALGVFAKLKSPLCVMDSMDKLCVPENTFVPPVFGQKKYDEGYKTGGTDRQKDIEDNHGDYFSDYGYCPDCDQCDNCDRPSENSYEEMEASRDEWKAEAEQLGDKVSDLEDETLDLGEKIKTLEGVIKALESK